MAKYYLMVGNETVNLDDITIFNTPMTKIDNLIRFTSAFKDKNELLYFLKQCRYISEDNNGIISYKSPSDDQKSLKERIIYSDNADLYNYDNIVQIILDNATDEHFMDALTQIVYDRYNSTIGRLKRYYNDAEKKLDEVISKYSSKPRTEGQEYYIKEAYEEWRIKKNSLSSFLKRKKELDRIKESIEKISLSYEETSKRSDVLDEKSLIETLIKSDPTINQKEALLGVQQELKQLENSKEGYEDLFDLINLLLNRQTKSYELKDSDRFLLECADAIIRYAKFNPLKIRTFKKEMPPKKEPIVEEEFFSNLIEEDSFDKFKNKIMVDNNHEKKKFVNLIYMEALKRLVEAKSQHESEETINYLRKIVYALNAELNNSTSKINLGYLFYNYEKIMRELFKRLDSKYVSSYIDINRKKAHS